MIFSSKVLSSSSSSSAARTGPAAITRPMPRAIAVEAADPPAASARRAACTIFPFASVSRIALFLLRYFSQVASLEGGRHFEGPYRPGSGRFCGGYPQEGIIQ